MDGTPIPLDSEGCLPINYVGPTGSIRKVPFREVLAAAERKNETRGATRRITLQKCCGACWNGGRHVSGPISNALYVSVVLAMVPFRGIAAAGAADAGRLEIHANIAASRCLTTHLSAGRGSWQRRSCCLLSAVFWGHCWLDAVWNLGPC